MAKKPRRGVGGEGAGMEGHRERVNHPILNAQRAWLQAVKCS